MRREAEGRSYFLKTALTIGDQRDQFSRFGAAAPRRR
jgi:hypothetical protein